MPDIHISNATSENIRVAVVKKSYKQASLGTVAWRVIAPPQKGFTKVSVPPSYEVFVNYPGPEDDRTDAYAGNQTRKILLGGYTGRFIVNSSKTPDGRDVVADITQSFQELIPEECHIVNQAGFGVWGHITKGGSDIFPPQVITPGNELIEDLRPTLYLAILQEFVKQGDRVLEEEISSTLTEILVNQTATISGSMWDGYGIVVADGTPNS
jgi:hypothetical protein